MWCFWSAKGGVGCTVVVAGTALGLAANRPTLVVDLGGDIPAVLGHRVEGFGIADWLEAVAPPPDALARMEVEVGPGLTVLPWRGVGSGPTESVAQSQHEEAAPDLWADPAETLARVIALDHREVIVDLGQLDGLEDSPSCRPVTPRSQLAARLLTLASRSTLVTRPCYLAIRSAEHHPSPDDVIVVGRQNRSLGAAEVQGAIGAPVVAKLRWDPAVARAVDAGLVISRPPRSLRALSELTVEAVG